MTGDGQDGVGGIEGAFDGEQGGVGEGDDERLGSGVDVVGRRKGNPVAGVRAHDRSSNSAWRMRVRTSRSTSFFFFLADARRAAVAIRSVSRRELAAASCRMAMASTEKMSWWRRRERVGCAGNRRCRRGRASRHKSDDGVWSRAIGFDEGEGGLRGR